MRAALVVAAALTAAAALAEVDAGAAARAIVEQTNALRSGERLAPTRPNARLASTAQIFAAFMADSDRYGHQADGREPAERATAQGYAWCLVAENIAYVQDARLTSAEALARQLVDNWRGSPGHRRNMLDADVTETGVAVAYGGRSGRWYAVQLFGRPQSERVRFEIANRSAQGVDYDLDGKRYPLAPNQTRSHERCRSTGLALRLPGRQQPLLLAPQDGQLWRVEGTGDGLRVVPGAG